MSQSRLFVYICLVFAAGAGMSSFFKADFEVSGIVILLLFFVSLFSIKEKYILLLGLMWVIFYLGLGYGTYFGENNLIHGNMLSMIVTLMTNIRNHIESLPSRMIAEPYSTLMKGILLGGKNGLGYELTSDFKTTGLMHIIAVSGYNVTIIINSFYLMAKPMPYKLRMGLSLGLIFLFIILTGGSASVVRAGMMGGLVVIARLFGRKALALNSLIIAGFLMIVEKPCILANDIGFQLSVAATLGLIVVSPILMKRVGERGVLKKLPENLREILISTLAATAMTWPIIFYYFKTLSLVSPIANLIILPTIPLMMAIGFAVILIGLIYFPLGYILSFGAWFMLYIIVWLVKHLASIPYASVILPDYCKWLIVPYYIFVFWIVHRNLQPPDIICNDQNKIVFEAQK